MINRFFTTRFEVQRPEWSGDSAGLTDVEGCSGHVQQARPELTQQLGLSMTKTFTIWCADTADVQEGDMISGGGYVYSVRAVQVNNYGINSHKELVVERIGQLLASVEQAVSVFSLLFSIPGVTVSTPGEGGGGGGSP